MKRNLLQSLFLCLAFLIASARHAGAEEPVVLDFRHSHDLQIVRDAGIIRQDFPDGLTTLAVTHLRLLLPGNNEIQMDHVKHAVIRVSKAGELESLYFHGGGYPADVAYEIAKKLHMAYDIPLKRLEDWIEENRGTEWGKRSFSNGYRHCYPIVHLEITSAVNRLYPWKISFSLNWNPLAQSDASRDEAWGWENNPRPPEALRRVSLNPADGRQYDPMDAYRDLAGRQEALDKKLGQVCGPDGRLIRAEKPAPSEEDQIVAGESRKRFLWPVLLLSLAIGVMALTFGIRKWLSKPL